VLDTVQIPKAMQVILLRDMDKLGDRFDIVAVKNGYGRNFLIPQGIAQIANKINLANLEEIKKSSYFIFCLLVKAYPLTSLCFLNN